LCSGKISSHVLKSRDGKRASISEPIQPATSPSLISRELATSGTSPASHGLLSTEHEGCCWEEISRYGKRQANVETSLFSDTSNIYLPAATAKKQLIKKKKKKRKVQSMLLCKGFPEKP